MSTKPMRVFLSPLTGRAYVLARYAEDAGSGRIVADEKHDVTADVVHDLMAAAWARGWNECNAATEGDAPPNPYRPHAAQLAAQRPTPACPFRAHYGEPCDCEARLAAVVTHTRASTDVGPDYCAECSEAVSEWMPWPCPATRPTPAPTEES